MPVPTGFRDFIHYQLLSLLGFCFLFPFLNSYVYHHISRYWSGVAIIILGRECGDGLFFWFTHLLSGALGGFDFLRFADFLIYFTIANERMGRTRTRTNNRNYYFPSVDLFQSCWCIAGELARRGMHFVPPAPIGIASRK